MPQVWDKGRPPVWIFRARPYDPAVGFERNVWFATTDIESDETFEGWLDFGPAVSRVVVGGNDTTVLDQGSNTSFAVAVRFRTSVQQTAMLVGKGITSPNAIAGSDATGFQVGVRSVPDLIGTLGDSLTIDPAVFAVNYADGEWHTAYIVVDGSTIDLFYDGVLRDSDARNSVNLTNDFNLTFGDGRVVGQAEFDGDIERVLFFEGNVSPSVIDTLMDARDLSQEVIDNPVGVLEGAWPINAGFGRTAQDVSGNGFDGHLGSLTTLSFQPTWSKIAPPPGTIRGLLSRPYSVSGSLLRGQGRLSTRALPSFGAVGINNPDGVLDFLGKWHWDGRLTEHRLGLEGDLVTDYDTMWVGQAEQPNDLSEEGLSIAIQGIEDVFRDEVQQDLFRPGFEPYVAFDGANDWIDFGDNLDRGNGGLMIGCAFRTTVTQTAGLYGKKRGINTINAGYLLSLGGGGALRLDLGDGASSFVINQQPSGGYNTGDRIAFIGRVQRSTDTAFLYANVYDGTGWQLLGTVDITGMGSLDNADSLAIGASNSGGSNFFDGEVERVLFGNSGGPFLLQEMQNALDEPFLDDINTTPFSHFVPLTENSGTLVGDLSSSEVDGTLTNFADTEAAWSGTPNGTKDFEGKPKPFMRGRTSLNPAVWVDNEKLIIMAFNGNFASSNIFSVREGFVPIEEDTITGGDIFSNPPQAGQWRQQVTTVGGNTGVFIRLGSRPTGTITWSGDFSDAVANEEQFYPSTLFGIIALHVAGTVGVINGQAELEAAAPYISGHYWDSPVRGSRALDESLEGVGAHWTIDPRDPFDVNGNLSPTILQARDLTGETPLATYLLDPEDLPSDVAEEGFRQIGLAPVYRKVVIQYNRYRGFLSSGSEPQSVGVGSPVPFKLVTELMQEWRAVEAPATQEAIDAVLNVFKDAEEHRIESGIWRRPDAAVEAQRIFDLHNRLNRTYRVELTGGLFEHWIGDVIAITATRILSEPGQGEVTKLFLVVGVDDDARNSGSRLELWGGFDPV